MQRKWRRLMIALVVAIVAVTVTTVRLFVWPAGGAPARASAIVMLNSPGDPLSVASRLARQQRARFLVILRVGRRAASPARRPCLA